MAVARPVAQTAEDLHKLLVKLAAVCLEDSLVTGLADEVIDLRLRLVIHLLHAGRMDPAVFEQPLQRELRHLAPDAVERREHDCLRRVVDDEVHAGQMLECSNVAAFTTDDPALHVVGGKLDDGDRRLGGVARRHALECVGHEVPRLPTGLSGRVLVELPHAPRQFVADELLGALEDLRLRIFEGQPGNSFQTRSARRPSQTSTPPVALVRASRGRRGPGCGARAPRASGLARPRRAALAARARAFRSGARRGLARSRCALSLPPPWRPARTLCGVRPPLLLPLRAAGVRVRRAAASFESVRKLTTAQAPTTPATRPIEDSDNVRHKPSDRSPRRK